MSSILGNLFDFRSKEEKARSYEAYSKRIFPYGEEQKNAVSELLASLFPNENPKYLLMYYILIKQGMTEEEALDFDTAAKKAVKCKLLTFTPEIKAGMKALLKIDLTINEKLEYPSIEELRDAACDNHPSNNS